MAVRPTDMDADHNVNNAVYFEYFQHGRLNHLTHLGFWEPGRSGGSIFALAENTCRYYAPSYYGDELLIWTATHAVGRSSFQLVYQVWRESDEAMIVAGHSVQVWLDEANRSAQLPDAVKAALTESLCPDLPKMPSRDSK